MLSQIEITQLVLPSHTRYKPEQSVNQSQKLKRSSLLTEISNDPSHSKKIVPVKEYSNKFLRQSSSKENQKWGNRVNVIVSKHKNFQKKYQKILGKKHYVCKTEPNQNEYKCFTTSKQFYQPEVVDFPHIKTETMIEKSFPPLDQQDNEQQAKQKQKQEGLIPNKKDQKISTSRALQLFARIVSKDKGDLLEKVKLCNQKKVLKEKLMQSSKNLEARQIILTEKGKKMSVAERGQRRCSLKNGLKGRQRKRSHAHKLFRDEQNFQIRGWDVAV